MTSQPWRLTALRWLKFNLVGGMGIVVQLLLLVALKTGLGLDYLLATALAVEAAVVHNFLWHERFTWVDRPGASSARFLKFNLTTGLFSIAGNLVVMKLLVGFGHMNYLLANAITITLCSVVNFLVSDGFVFAPAGRDLSPCDRAPAAPRTRHLPVSAQAGRRGPSIRRSGA
jgi:putative flippase GtrA